MKLAIGDTIVNSLMLHTDTDDATLVASDMQAGVTGYSKGVKVTGSGKAFAFAVYGEFLINELIPIPVSEINTINTINISSVSHMVKMEHSFNELRELDFSISQTVAVISIDGINYPITINVSNNIITVACDNSQNIKLKAIFGKDEYI